MEGVNAVLKKKTQGAGLCDFKQTLVLQIRRNEMGYVSKERIRK